MLPTDEPTTAEAIRDFKLQARAANDRFASVVEASDAHREEHGCDTFPTGVALLVGAIAAASRPTRIVEVGCGLGYSALHLAHAAGRDAHVETTERQPLHAELAERHIADAGLADQITTPCRRGVPGAPSAGAVVRRGVSRW